MDTATSTAVTTVEVFTKTPTPEFPDGRVDLTVTTFEDAVEAWTFAYTAVFETNLVWTVRVRSANVFCDLVTCGEFR